MQSLGEIRLVRLGSVRFSFLTANCCPTTKNPGAREGKMEEEEEADAGYGGKVQPIKQCVAPHEKGFSRESIGYKRF